METLPDEVLVKIMTNLSPDQLITVGEVSQTFSRVASDSSLWKTISLTKNEPSLRLNNDLSQRLLTISELEPMVKKILGTVYSRYYTKEFC